MNSPKSKHASRIRVLTATDLHQYWMLYQQLALAIDLHRPDAVAIVGDALDMWGHSGGIRRYSTAECAKFLAALPVEHLIFVRGNHEDANWPEFVAAWPHKRRPLTALYGTACTVGPLVIIGFPCLTGSEFNWCAHLPLIGNTMITCPDRNRQPLSADYSTWLPKLMRAAGPAGRTLWLMHESPLGKPLSDAGEVNSWWTDAVTQYDPKIVVCGHDHDMPMLYGTWHGTLGNSFVINAGQTAAKLRYTVLDFEFNSSKSALPRQMTATGFLGNQKVVIAIN